ncbi:DUF1428 domain-containing protein [Croceicoccus ponticola]|uniref:DUF1428 domain-containing protein n=1 Tax=Croceicoccus ponticola TaxID=2217664 RepID=A0A437GXK3_9SPHN|nr:DUF1428 domain-containing protein [Croceicoccus ponticola]RVQ65966.1 DUF1428 domain-containing protein [Croceicoccus ponticola]
MYVQGFVIPVAEGRMEDYRKMAAEAGEWFREYGAIEVVECAEADIVDGKTTDFRMAVKAQPGEKIVFSWMIWPDRATCDAAAAKMQEDERFKMPDDMPFDGKRMIFGGFDPIYTLGR